MCSGASWFVSVSGPPEVTQSTPKQDSLGVITEKWGCPTTPHHNNDCVHHGKMTCSVVELNESELFGAAGARNWLRCGFYDKGIRC